MDKQEWPLEKCLEYLRHLDQFQAFLDSIKIKREEEIRSLSGADDGEIREISGKIQAFDTILSEGRG